MRTMLLVGLLLAGCGGEEGGDYEPRCERFCEPSGSAADHCDGGDVDACVGDCVAHTDGLAVECASCLIEESYGLAYLGFECEGPSMAPINAPACVRLCEPPAGP